MGDVIIHPPAAPIRTRMNSTFNFSSTTKRTEKKEIETINETDFLLQTQTSDGAPPEIVITKSQKMKWSAT